MRRPFIAGNWKMKLSKQTSIELAERILASAESINGIEAAICPPSVYLDAVSGVVRGTKLGLGAQNVYFEQEGPYTGEVSASMLLDVGCRYVIIGHSERRHLLGETDEIINRKLHAALQAGLIPIVCVGEVLEERSEGQTLRVISDQFAGSFAGLAAEQMSKTVIAYEPVWAIGTGQVASPEQAEEVHASIRELITDQFGGEIAESVRIQYGGSVKPDNAGELLAQPNIDGALVGGASLAADSFVAIVGSLQPT